MSLGTRLVDSNRGRFGASRFRARRAELVRARILRIAREKSACRVIDLGGELRYWERVGIDFLREHRATVHLVNVRKIDVAPAAAEIVTSEVGDACDLPDLADNSFDLCHSNSVIEHVGHWERMAAFASEVRRLAPGYFVQTPNFWFPLEPHFAFVAFHWLPEPVRVSLRRRMDLGWYQKTDDVGSAVRSVQSINLLNAVMMRTLFPDAELVRERIGPLTKSFIAIR